METTATIRRCGSQWCLYTHDGSRLLGKHETKEKALRQERAIKAHGALTTTLDEVAEQLEARGAVDLAQAVDATNGELLTQRRGVLDETGFDDVMKRDEDAAEEIYEHPLKPVDPNVGLTTY